MVPEHDGMAMEEELPRELVQVDEWSQSSYFSTVWDPEAPCALGQGEGYTEKW